MKNEDLMYPKSFTVHPKLNRNVRDHHQLEEHLAELAWHHIHMLFCAHAHYSCSMLSHAVMSRSLSQRFNAVYGALTVSQIINFHLQAIF